MEAGEQLEYLAGSWRDRHGPEVMRRRSTCVVETMTIVFQDGRMAKLSRKAGEPRYTVDVDPDVTTPVSLDHLPPHIRANVLESMGLPQEATP
jgi:hypothetical protein